MIPCVPFLPLVPFGPRLPRGPGGPATQTFPGARQTDPTIIDVTYLLIMCRISCIPTEPLKFTRSAFLRTMVPLYSVPLEKKIHLKYFPHYLMFWFGRITRIPSLYNDHLSIPSYGRSPYGHLREHDSFFFWLDHVQSWVIPNSRNRTRGHWFLICLHGCV